MCLQSSRPHSTIKLEYRDRRGSGQGPRQGLKLKHEDGLPGVSIFQRLCYGAGFKGQLRSCHVCSSVMRSPEHKLHKCALSAGLSMWPPPVFDIMEEFLCPKSFNNIVQRPRAYTFFVPMSDSKPNTLRLPSSQSACGQRNKPRAGFPQGFSLTLTFSRILGDTGWLVHEADHFSADTSSHFTLSTLREIGADFPPLHFFLYTPSLSSVTGHDLQKVRYRRHIVPRGSTAFIHTPRGESRRELARGDETLISPGDLEIVRERITCHVLNPSQYSRIGGIGTKERYLQAREYRKSAKETPKFVKSVSERARDGTLGLGQSSAVAVLHPTSGQRPSSFLAVSLQVTVLNPILNDFGASSGPPSSRYPSRQPQSSLPAMRSLFGRIPPAGFLVPALGPSRMPRGGLMSLRNRRHGLP
ncbi:hypothetical protein EDB86DRAFT_2834256 [Lactarius hatsudake]|nr:hypothetical protein EDB86DRAFT_2834256 [Lactarius hatsudake]